MEDGETSSQRASHPFAEFGEHYSGQNICYPELKPYLSEITASLPYGNVSMIAMPTARPLTNETKPRIDKDGVEVLEREFKKNPKPTTQTKRQFAVDMGVELARINNWFQNRRAKRKQEKMQEAYEAGQIQDGLESPGLVSLRAFYGNGYFGEQETTPPTSPPTTAYNPLHSEYSCQSMKSLLRTTSTAQTASQDDFTSHSFVNPAANVESIVPLETPPTLSSVSPPPDLKNHGQRQSLIASTNPDNNRDRATMPPTCVQCRSKHLKCDGLTPCTRCSVDSFDCLYVKSRRGFNGPRCNGTQSKVSSTPVPVPITTALDQEHVSGGQPQHFSPNETLPSPILSKLPARTANIASRRNKVVKPLPLALSPLRSLSRGPRIVPHSETPKKPRFGSPCSPAGCTVEFGGHRSVLSGRPNATWVRQNSPKTFAFPADYFTFTAQDNRSFGRLPSLSAGSSVSSVLDPPVPTPLAPILLQTAEGFTFQHPSPPKMLPLLLEQDQEHSDNDYDKMDELPIKVERYLGINKVDRDEGASNGDSDRLDGAGPSVDTESVKSASDHSKEERECLVLSMLDSLRNSLIDRVMDEFWLTIDQKWNAQASQCAGSSPTSSGEGSARENPEASASSSFQSKRQRDDRHGQPGDDNNKRPRRQSTYPGSSKGLRGQPRFACPFRKRDNQKYNIYDHRVCALTNWDTIARVKEHLYRNHKTAPYCKRCWQVFETEELLDSHATLPTKLVCEVLPGHPPDGVTPKQVSALKSKARPYSNQSEEERWREIFRLLFPDESVPSPYWEPVQEQGALLPDSDILARYDGYMHRELPSLFRIRVEEIIRREMQPIEASLVGNLDLVGLIHECQDQLSREYRATVVKEEPTNKAPLGRAGVLAGSVELKSKAEKPQANAPGQEPLSSPELCEAVLQAPPPKGQDNLEFGFNSLDDTILNWQKQTSRLPSDSESGYASGRLCDCSGSCSCLGWTIVSGTDEAVTNDSLAACLPQNQTESMQEESVQWQSWMESGDWVADQ